MRRHRRRNHSGAVRPERRTGRLVSVIILGILIVIGCVKVLQYFGVGNSTLQSAAILSVDDLGVVNVSIDEGPFKRGDDGMKIYPGDAVVTTPKNFAALTMFDGSYVRMDESTELGIEQSILGETESSLKLSLDDGAVWIVTPTSEAFSGAIIRQLATPFLTIAIPSKTEAVFTARSLVVYASDGPGLSVKVTGFQNPVIVGEGQQFTFALGSESVTDLYTLRNPVSPDLLSPPFIEESRAEYGIVRTAGTSIPDEEIERPDTEMTVSEPVNDITVQGATLQVKGTIGDGVDKVRINGYLATINREQKTFEQELTLPDEDDVKITVEAIDKNGTVLSQALRTVRRNRTPPEAPSITAPAAAGQTYRTSKTQVEIRGTAPDNAVAIIVNDYRLQLFTPGEKNWSYLADTAFNNLHAGENIFEVVAMNQGGYRSEPVRITVLLEEGEEGIVGGSTSQGSTETVAPTTPKTAEESELPDNAPLMPGSIRITSPKEGTEYSTTDKEFLIEGSVPTEAASVWVNGYKLQLYEQGKLFFNYIASTDLATLRRGRNVYRIVIRNAENNILDSLSYTVQFSPN